MAAPQLALRFGWMGQARRVTWYAGSRDEAGAAALIGLGGVDLAPEPGSKAEKRQQWVRARPRLYTARETGLAVAGVLGGLLVTWLLARLVFSIDLPDIPWPDVPSIPWPDVSLPGWVKEAAEMAKFVLPVLIAFGVARGEIRRRRLQEERRTAAAAGSETDDGGSLDSGHDHGAHRPGHDRDGR